MAKVQIKQVSYNTIKKNQTLFDNLQKHDNETTDQKDN